MYGLPKELASVRPKTIEGIPVEEFDRAALAISERVKKDKKDAALGAINALGYSEQPVEPQKQSC